MPFTHRNLLVMMIVGCVVGMFGAGKTACAIADNELTIQLDVSATNVSRDDFFFWFSTDITSAVNADSSHAPLPVPLMEQTFWWKDYPQGIIVKGLTSQRMIIGRDPSGLGFENNTAVDGNNPTNSGYLLRWQPIEITFNNDNQYSNGQVNLTNINYYSLPLSFNVNASSGAAVGERINATDKAIRQALSQVVPSNSNQCKVIDSQGNFVRYSSPTGANFNYVFSKIYPSFESYLTSIPGDGTRVANFNGTVGTITGVGTEAQCSTVVNSTNVDCTGYNYNVTVDSTATNITFNFSGVDNEGGGALGYSFSGTYEDYTNAIYREDWPPPNIAHSGGSTCGLFLWKDICTAINTGMINASVEVKAIPGNQCQLSDGTYEPLFSLTGSGQSFVLKNIDSASWKYMKEAYSSVAPSTSTPHYNVWSDALNKVQAAGYSTQNMDTWRGRSKSPLVTFPAGQDATLTISLNDLTLGPVTCNGDLNSTFHTDIDDLLLMIEGWGHGTDGDVTGDGFSDVDDLLVVLGDYGCDHR